MPETIASIGASNFIAGKWSPSRTGRTRERRNPWRPTEVVGDIATRQGKRVQLELGGHNPLIVAAHANLDAAAQAAYAGDV